MNASPPKGARVDHRWKLLDPTTVCLVIDGEPFVFVDPEAGQSADWERFQWL